jgi:cob(I)alamin adenosyltransferase
MAIRINRVYTRSGDGGTTHLVGGASVRKDSLRVEAYGTVDELNSIIGLARTFNDELLGREEAAGRRSAASAAAELADVLMRLQNELFDLGSELATPAGAEYPGMFRVGDAEVLALEHRIDRHQEDLEALKSFVLPGGGMVGAFLHQARTVCRRAERDVLRLAAAEEIGDGPIKYLNRLSDLLFVLSRWIARRTDTPEYLWERGLHLGETPRKEGPSEPRSRKETPGG